MKGFELKSLAEKFQDILMSMLSHGYSLLKPNPMLKKISLRKGLRVSAINGLLSAGKIPPS